MVTAVMWHRKAGLINQCAVNLRVAWCDAARYAAGKRKENTAKLASGQEWQRGFKNNVVRWRTEAELETFRFEAG